MSKVEDYARPLDAIEILVDEHALPGRLTPLGDITDMRFVATPDTVAVLERALADGMREGASLSEMTAHVEASMVQIGGAVRERMGPILAKAEADAWVLHDLAQEKIREVFPSVHDVVRITEPTLLSVLPPASRYVIEEGGSISGIKEGARISEGIRWDGPNGGYMWAATTERIPAPNTAERATLKRLRAERKRRKKLAAKSKRRNR